MHKGWLIVLWATQFTCCCSDSEMGWGAVCAGSERIEFWGRPLRTKDMWENDNCRALGWKVDRTGSGSCPLAGGFGNDCPEPPGSATRILTNKTDLKEMGCESGRQRKLAQDRVQWWYFGTRIFYRLTECRRAGGIFGRCASSMSSALRRAARW